MGLELRCLMNVLLVVVETVTGILSLFIWVISALLVRRVRCILLCLMMCLR